MQLYVLLWVGRKSKIKGWRLFALVAAYCDCSETLRPYLFKYLETTATDVNRTYNRKSFFSHLHIMDVEVCLFIS